MPRWVRIILTGIAAAFGGYAGLMTFGGTAAGVAWLFLFGDNVWPKWSEPAILIIALVGTVVGVVALGLAAWRATGNKRD